MNYTLLKRILVLIIPIVYYVLCLYGLNQLTSISLINPEEWGKTPYFYYVFLVENVIVLLTYQVLLNFLIDKESRENNSIDELEYAMCYLFVGSAFCLCAEFRLQYLWIVLMTAVIIYMISFTFRIKGKVRQPFIETKIVGSNWQLENQGCVWTFFSNHTLIINSLGNKAALYNWEFDEKTRTITAFNGNERKCYGVYDDYPNSGKLTIISLSSFEKLAFTRVGDWKYLYVPKCS